MHNTHVGTEQARSGPVFNHCCWARPLWWNRNPWLLDFSVKTHNAERDYRASSVSIQKRLRTLVGPLFHISAHLLSHLVYIVCDHLVSGDALTFDLTSGDQKGFQTRFKENQTVD